MKHDTIVFVAVFIAVALALLPKCFGVSEKVQWICILIAFIIEMACVALVVYLHHKDSE